MKVNLNNIVKFQITEFGKTTLHKYCIRLEEYYKVPKDIVAKLRLKYDSEIVEMPLWDFMNIFGSVSIMGADNICVDNEIEICQSQTVFKNS